VRRDQDRLPLRLFALCPPGAVLFVELYSRRRFHAASRFERPRRLCLEREGSQQLLLQSCGIFTYIGDGENNRDGYRVNLGCVEGIDPLTLDIDIIDGKSLPVVEGQA